MKQHKIQFHSISLVLEQILDHTHHLERPNNDIKHPVNCFISILFLFLHHSYDVRDAPT